MTSKRSPSHLPPAKPLSIEELEAGLRLLGRGDLDHRAFWEENIEAFRQTVLFAIRDTSDALRSPQITLRWRVQLQTQLEALVQYIDFADGYAAKRSVNCAPAAWEIPSERFH